MNVVEAKNAYELNWDQDTLGCLMIDLNRHGLRSRNKGPELATDSHLEVSCVWCTG